MCDQRQSSEPLPPRQPSQRVRALPGDDNSLPEAVASLHAAIQKIKINERDMKMLLEQTKSVLESKISEIDHVWKRLIRLPLTLTALHNHWFSCKQRIPGFK
jgi:hypothetical protein